MEQPFSLFRLVLLSKIIFGTVKPYRNPEVLPQILRSLLGTRSLSGNPEARLLPVPVRISHPAARKLATIKFLCCILLLQEVTDMLKGCWCVYYDPSVRLCCFPRLDK
ncbi:hypothetical protein Bca101_091083 [Brassica carinata]